MRFDIRDELTQETHSTGLNAGENLHLHLSVAKLANFEVHVVNYLGVSWLSMINWPQLLESKEETIQLEMQLAPTTQLHVSGKHLTIYVSYKKPNEFTLYSPYWLLNKSGQQIQIKVGCLLL